MEFAMIGAFFIYLSILLIIAAHSYYQTQSSQGYLVGNRSINYLTTAIATQASDMGAWLFLSLPAAVYTTGLTSIWIPIGLIIGTFVNWHFIAPKLRRATEKYNSLTLSSFLESHYKDTTGTIRLLTGIGTLLFFTVYIASGLMGMAQIFKSTFGLTYHAGIFVGIATAITYTTIGGFIAVARCDLFQGLFLLGVIMLVPIYTFFNINGLQTITTIAAQKQISLTLFSSVSELLHGILLALGWGLAYFGQPHILLNFMGIDDEKNIRYAKYVGLTWQALVLTASVAIGLVGMAYLPDLTNPELLFSLLCQQLFSPFFSGLMLCGVLAATLSTLDSHIFISGSVIAQDMYKKSINKNATEKQVVWLSRFSSIVISCIAILLIYNSTDSIHTFVEYAWSGLGSAFGPLIIMTLYGKYATKYGAIAGIIVGCIVAAFSPYLTSSLTPLIPGFFSSLLTIVLVSCMTQQKTGPTSPTGLM